MAIPAASPTPTPDLNEGLRRAAAQAIDELKAARRLIKAQDGQIQKQEEVLALQKEISDMLRRINLLSDREKQELRKALAKKDRVIQSLENENATLKKNASHFGRVLRLQSWPQLPAL